MSETPPVTHPYRLWWIPQVPLREGNSPFVVETPTLEEAFRLEATLAQYDLYQLATRVKPDYANAGGVERWLEGEQEWESVDADDVGMLEAQISATVNVDAWKAKIPRG